MRGTALSKNFLRAVYDAVELGHKTQLSILAYLNSDTTHRWGTQDLSWALGYLVVAKKCLKEDPIPETKPVTYLYSVRSDFT